MRSYVSITKLKRELKFDNNVFVERKLVEGGYSGIKMSERGSFAGFGDVGYHHTFVFLGLAIVYFFAVSVN
jgi:hypothetical protein